MTARLFILVVLLDLALIVLGVVGFLFFSDQETWALYTFPGLAVVGVLSFAVAFRQRARFVHRQQALRQGGEWVR